RYHRDSALFPYTTLFRSMDWRMNCCARSSSDDNTLAVSGLSNRKSVVVEGPLAYRMHRHRAALEHELGLQIYTLPLLAARIAGRSEEHTSELQSRGHLVC